MRKFREWRRRRHNRMLRRAFGELMRMTHSQKRKILGSAEEYLASNPDIEWLEELGL